MAVICFRYGQVKQSCRNFISRAYTYSSSDVKTRKYPLNCRWTIMGGNRNVSSSPDPNRLVLGIETSCDDTGAAVVDEKGNIVGEALNSQTKFHVEMGGIIPDIARDLHKKHIQNVVSTALERASINVQDVDAIAVTVKPGLIMSLRVGMEHAVDLALQSKKPLIPIHHMEAHALTARMLHRLEFPFLVLLASGGHCLLAVARGVEDFLLLGSNLDIAPGDVYDKFARNLKLKNLPQCHGMCGGQAVEMVAKDGNPRAFELRTILSQFNDCNFSFSGLGAEYKSRIKAEEERQGIQGGNVLPNAADLCASFQYNVLHHMAKRVQRALVFCHMEELLPQENTKLVVSGGVASNQFLRRGLQKLCDEYDCQVICPPPKLCTDNGIMIAWNGMEKLKAGVGIAENPEAIELQPKCPLGKDLREEVPKRSIPRLSSVKLMDS